METMLFNYQHHIQEDMVVDSKISFTTRMPILLLELQHKQLGSGKTMTTLSPTIRIFSTKKTARQPTLKFSSLEEFLYISRKGIKTGNRMNNLMELISTLL